MAALLERSSYRAGPECEEELVYYTTLEPGVTITHTCDSKSPIGVAPDTVDFCVTERPTTRDVVSCFFDRSASVTSSTAVSTVALQFDTVVGGDLTGAEVQVRLRWLKRSSGGVS